MNKKTVIALGFFSVVGIILYLNLGGNVQTVKIKKQHGKSLEKVSKTAQKKHEKSIPSTKTVLRKQPNITRRNRQRTISSVAKINPRVNKIKGYRNALEKYKTKKIKVGSEIEILPELIALQKKIPNRKEIYKLSGLHIYEAAQIESDESVQYMVVRDNLRNKHRFWTGEISLVGSPDKILEALNILPVEKVEEAIEIEGSVTVNYKNDGNAEKLFKQLKELNLEYRLDIKDGSMTLQ